MRHFLDDEKFFARTTSMALGMAGIEFFELLGSHQWHPGNLRPVALAPLPQADGQIKNRPVFEFTPRPPFMCQTQPLS